MLKSMTAFAASEQTSGNLTVNTEIRSYNSRHLDTVLRIPGSYQPLEERIKSLIAAGISRGRVEVTVQIKLGAGDVCFYEIDEAKAKGYHAALLRLRDLLQLQTEIPLELVAGSGIVRPAEAAPDMEAAWLTVQASLTEAVAAHDAMRLREGKAISDDFEDRLLFIEKSLDQIEAGSSGLISYYRERLKERITALTSGLIEIDDTRITQEAALMADRSDISEEIVRARSHIRQFRTIMTAPEPAGRKLNFLLQEFNREFNTMGSKAGNEKISHIIVDVKSEVEKLREQVQNVE